MKNKLRNLLTVVAVIAFIGAIQGYDGPGSVITGADKGACVVLDAGHGGIDGGAESFGGVCEKDINLSIAKKLKQQLEKEGVAVIMTRTTDEGLYERDAHGAIRTLKTYDMRKRREIIDDAGADLAVSIHLNSFTEDTSVRGAQVFYPEYGRGNSVQESKKAAAGIQKDLNEYINGENQRSELAKSDVILMRDVVCPTIIVECGFLSNEDEASMLRKKSYQEKIVKVLKKSICSYLGEKTSENE